MSGGILGKESTMNSQRHEIASTWIEHSVFPTEPKLCGRNDTEEIGRARKKETLNKRHAKCLGLRPSEDERH